MAGIEAFSVEFADTASLLGPIRYVDEKLLTRILMRAPTENMMEWYLDAFGVLHGNIWENVYPSRGVEAANLLLTTPEIYRRVVAEALSWSWKLLSSPIHQDLKTLVLGDMGRLLGGLIEGGMTGLELGAFVLANLMGLIPDDMKLNFGKALPLQEVCLATGYGAAFLGRVIAEMERGQLMGDYWWNVETRRPSAVGDLNLVVSGKGVRSEGQGAVLSEVLGHRVRVGAVVPSELRMKLPREMEAMFSEKLYVAGAPGLKKRGM